MDTVAWAAIIVGIVAILAIVWVVMRERNSRRLRSRFGPEYDRVVEGSKDRNRAEHELARREERVRKFHIRDLTAAERDRFVKEWLQQQSHFVDQPARAVSEADGLITDVMNTRGYPMGDFETQAADLSVEHPHVVENYREAHAIAGRSSAGGTTTEDLRRAMVCFRALFEDLVGRRVFSPEHEEVRR